ncbi:glycosyltransferase family 2 protein [Romboutsia lituseburensis]|uniref:glycosyltransferase family 2 protein n=1 Tax=Romboutsia lituseburensis TaxID=1537 RepID=UPI00215B607D|nr:glycosyltransferase family 2 protein [Romboutsia lituseburensis]MCR8745450.1 glycosyltransferase family 2 protein [Romboutsia lituseburensis]
MKKIIYLVIPCYNEEAVLYETSKQLEIKMSKLMENNKISNKSKIVFINDGSKDSTWNIITDLHNKSKIFSGINLSKNRGHQNALVAGLMTVRKYCDAAISLDADLQDDISVIDEFIDKFIEGYDIVYGVRNSRKKDTYFKRLTAQGFYKFMNKMGANIVYNHADYRLMSKRALDGLKEFKEVNLFLRGIIPMIGYKTDIVEYERHERFAGESKYPFKKMMSFAIDGITSLSIKPIRFITGLGFTIFAISIIMLLYFLNTYFRGKAIEGWTTIVISMWSIGGLQLLAIGIIGEYIGKIYMEVKSRPRFIIEEFLNEK